MISCDLHGFDSFPFRNVWHSDHQNSAVASPPACITVFRNSIFLHNRENLTPPIVLNSVMCLAPPDSSMVAVRPTAKSDVTLVPFTIHVTACAADAETAIRPRQIAVQRTRTR